MAEMYPRPKGIYDFCRVSKLRNSNAVFSCFYSVSVSRSQITVYIYHKSQLTIVNSYTIPIPLLSLPHFSGIFRIHDISGHMSSGCDPPLAGLMISWWIILPSILGTTIIQERGIPINQPVSWNETGILNTVHMLWGYSRIHRPLMSNALSLGKKITLQVVQAYAQFPKERFTGLNG